MLLEKCVKRINKIFKIENKENDNIDLKLANAIFTNVSKKEIEKALDELAYISPAIENYLWYPEENDLNWTGWKVYKAKFNKRNFLFAEGTYKNHYGKYLFFIDGKWRQRWYANYPYLEVYKGIWTIDFGKVGGRLKVKNIATVNMTYANI
ncbi:hypothetical protein [Thermoanaerobacterium sp. RBIITD]|uniref:hypothetical protein n=1 Tax=Thermoanaerobacterium sp. RBIITD TaxID=1550240 RepID=UPI000BB81876|nr:hypothetical protein [Thermoanaerobacterium sp. RBIITD]SNX54214.1 hypothetical protein SAMN05660242_1850 [Thermoanaerobacterium sp. RBIITD]